jgi:hypothetical protein
MRHGKVVLVAVAATLTVGLLQPAAGSAASSKSDPPGRAAFKAGAAVETITPPAFGAVPNDAADCTPPSPSSVQFDGPRRFAFEEPYNDAAHGISIHVTRVEDRARSGQSGGRKRAPEAESAPKLIDPIFRYRLPSGEFATITAREATVQFDMNEQQVLLALLDGHCETPGGNNFDFDREDQAFPMPAQTDTLKAPRNMTIDSLRRELVGLVRERDEALHRQVIKTVLALSEGNFERFSASEFQQVEFKESLRAERHQKLRTEIHGRVALSCSCFFFVLIGSPIAIIWGKRQFLTNFALCFTPILLGYYPIVLLTMNLCRDGVVEPAWGMWVGNAGLLATAIVVLRKVFRN